MTTPSRELPPLRVRLIGDGKSFSDMVKNAKKDANDLAKTVKNTLGKAAKGIATAQEKEFQRQFHNYRLLEKSHEIAHAKRLARMKSLDKAARKQVEDENKNARKRYSEDRKREAEAKRQAKANDRDLQSSVQDSLKADKAKQKSVEGLRKGFARLHKELATEDKRTRQERDRRNRQIDRSARQDRDRIDRHNRMMARAGRARTGGGGGTGFGGMGDRADIYMHSGALRSMAGAVGTVMQPMAQIENATTLLEVFTKDATKAAAIVQDMRAFAIQSPYGMRTLLDSTAMMAKFGINAGEAADMTKRLGEVAAGDAEKMGRLAYALGQVKTAGKLTGYELRQLTEAGFNPLMTIAKQTAKSMSDADIEARYAELEQMKADGLISSKAVIAALKVETSAGGDFAGVMQKLNNTVGGLTNQVIELVEALGVDIFSTLADQIKAALRVTIQYLTAMRKWVAENKEQVKQWANLIKQVFIAVAVFHLFGLAVAYVRWMFRSLFIMSEVLVGGLGLVRRAITGITWAFAAMRSGAAMAWLATLGPLNLIWIGLAAVAAWIVTVTVLAVGWTKTMKYAGMTLGFFYNIGHNLKVIFKTLGGTVNTVFTYILESMGLVGKGIYNMFQWIVGAATTLLTPLRVALGLVFEEIPKLMPELKFDLPSMGALDAFLGLKLEDLGKGPAIPDAEKIDWNALGVGSGGTGGKMEATPQARDAVMKGSGEHAVRQYEYSRALIAAKQGANVPGPEQKKIGLLEEIAKNTRPQPGGLNIVTANLTGSAP